MTTLSAIRGLVRLDLHDTDASIERWTDDQLDRHIAHAVAELNLLAPRQLSSTMATTPGSRDLDISALTGIIAVERVEFPAGYYPPCIVRFERWGENLTLLVSREPEGQDARVFYTAAHTLDGSGSTLPPELETLVVMGAAAFAVNERALFSAEQLNNAGPAVPEQLAAWGRARETAFRQLLREHTRRRRTGSRRAVLPIA
ncbi:MAG: hypothetical protein LC118_12315 [Dehalococcoidia bacterium]|nr:hypothetical protein [Dehalococcoidia bacterium]